MRDKNSFIDPVEGFDLRQYRNAVAKYVKLMIRARAKQEPKFLSRNQHERWHLSDIGADRLTVEQLLRMAEAAHDHLWREFIGPHGSGGVTADDPRAEFKQAVVGFTIGTPAGTLLEQLRDGQQIDWPKVAEWALLATIRDGLDALPEAEALPSGQHSDCPVVIVNEKQRLVEVLGQTKNLTVPRFAVIKALIDQYPGTYTKDELVRVSRHGGALSILKGLKRSDPVWESVIKLAGKTGGGYGLMKPADH